MPEYTQCGWILLIPAVVLISTIWGGAKICSACEAGGSHYYKGWAGNAAVQASPRRSALAMWGALVIWSSSTRRPTRRSTQSWEGQACNTLAGQYVAGNTLAGQSVGQSIQAHTHTSCSGAQSPTLNKTMHSGPGTWIKPWHVGAKCQFGNFFDSSLAWNTKLWNKKITQTIFLWGVRCQRILLPHSQKTSDS